MNQPGKGISEAMTGVKSWNLPSNAFFPRQCGYTEGVLTVRLKARYSIEVVGVVCGIFL